VVPLSKHKQDGNGYEHAPKVDLLDNLKDVVVVERFDFHDLSFDGIY
jgi:hypothetical protein